MTIQYLENTNGTWGTEYSLPNASTTLTPQTTAGQVQVFIDLSALVAGDEYELSIYEKARAADTQQLVERVTILGQQAKPLYVSPAITFSRGWDVTLKRITPTDRTITWSIRRWPDA